MKRLGRMKENMKHTRYFSYIFISIWKLVVFFGSVLFIIWAKGEDVGNFFMMFNSGFGAHKIIIEEVVSSIL